VVGDKIIVYTRAQFFIVPYLFSTNFTRTKRSSDVKKASINQKERKYFDSLSTCRIY